MCLAFFRNFFGLQINANAIRDQTQKGAAMFFHLPTSQRLSLKHEKLFTSFTLLTDLGPICFGAPQEAVPILSFFSLSKLCC